MIEITREIKEFITVKFDTISNNSQIARDVLRTFGLKKEVEAVRIYISKLRSKLTANAKAKPIKRLFFDIETGYYTLKIKTFQLKNYIKYFDPDTIEKEKEIICISYKWQYEDKVHTLDFRNGEKQMLKKFIKVLGEADEAIAHNGDNFDIKELRTKCLFNGVLMFPTYRTLDTLKKARQSFRFASNKLDYIAKYLSLGKKLEHTGFDLWERVIDDKCPKALKEMIEYCEQDVILLEDVYTALSPYIYHNTNFAKLKGGELWHCPECTGENVEMYKTYTTAMGVVRRNMKCDDCKKQYRISNKTYINMLQYSVNDTIIN